VRKNSGSNIKKLRQPPSSQGKIERNLSRSFQKEENAGGGCRFRPCLVGRPMKAAHDVGMSGWTKEEYRRSISSTGVSLIKRREGKQGGERSSRTAKITPERAKNTIQGGNVTEGNRSLQVRSSKRQNGLGESREAPLLRKGGNVLSEQVRFGEQQSVF